MKDNIVIVLDNVNYKTAYAEDRPFKAAMQYRFDYDTVVTSLAPGKEYELYPFA